MRIRSVLAAAAAVLFVAGCKSTADQTRDQLESVAKEWCQLIRASQVIPVYPPTEDLQPGDVFVVPLPLRDQAKIYDERGFLPLDQRVVRLPDVPYAGHYRNGFWEGTYGHPPHPRPGWGEGQPRAPRAAFPSYSFSVDRSAGFKLALPVQSVPVGLGFLGADKAVGSLALEDAFTYGIDVATVFPILWDWASAPEVSEVLAAAASQVEEEVFLRVVTQVFIVHSVNVTVSNVSARSGGADVGAAPEIELMNLAAEDPAKAETAIRAYERAVELTKGRLNDLSAGAGGAIRFAQATRRSVTLKEDFERPLVIGYQAFDVMVDKDGKISAPIPSFTALARISKGRDLGKNLEAFDFGAKDLSGDRIQAWLDADDKGNRPKLQGWMDASGAPPMLIYDFLEQREHAPLRREAIRDLQIPGP